MYDFTVLILEGAFSSSVAITRDILATAEVLAKRLGAAPLRWRLCSVEGGTVRLQGDMTIDTVKLPMNTTDDCSVWIVPGLGLNTHEAIRQRFEKPDAITIIRALAQHAEYGGQVAASCSAVFMLNAAGLLNGRRVTTTWWLAPLLQNIAPNCTVDADRMVCVDGQVITAGAAFAQSDLMLHLLRERCGNALRDSVSRMMLIDGRQAQAPFILPEVLASGNDLVALIAARIEKALPTLPSVGELAQEFCMSERTLSRHIHKATGKSTLALIQSVRLRCARNLLENSRLNVEQVAAAVGYQDATALRRLMKKTAGANPSKYRTILDYV